MSMALLVLLSECLSIGLAIRIEQFLAAFLPRGSHFRRRDVPVGPTFVGNGSQVLAKLFQSRPTEEPVTVVHLVNDKTGLENNHVRDHGIVERIGVFGDFEILLNYAPCVGKEWPVGTDSRAIFVRLSDVVGTNRDQPAVSNFKLAVKLN